MNRCCSQIKVPLACFLLALSITAAASTAPNFGDYGELEEESRDYKPLTAHTVPEAGAARYILRLIDMKDLSMRDHRPEDEKPKPIVKLAVSKLTKNSSAPQMLSASQIQTKLKAEESTTARIERLEKLVSAQKKLISKLTSRIRELEDGHHE